MRVEKQPEEKKPESFIAPQPIGKIVILIILAAASAVLFWYAWSRILATGISFTAGNRNIGSVIGTLFAFCLWLCLIGTASVVIIRIWYVLLLGVLAAASMFVFFDFSMWSLLAAAVLLLAMLFWHRRISADVKSRIIFMPTKTVGTGVKSTVSLILLAAALLYYSSLITGPAASEKFTDSMVSTGANAMQNVLDMYYKDKFSPKMPLDTFIANLSSADGDIQFSTGQKNLDQAIQQGFSQAQTELIAKTREEFLKTFGIQAAGDEPMRSVIEKIVRKNLDKYIGSYMKYIPAIMAVGLFFLLNIFNFIYSELIKSFSYVIFHVLVWVKFIKVQKTTVIAEKITL